MVLGSTWLESFQYYPIVMLFVSIGLELCDYWLMVIHLEILDEYYLVVMVLVSTRSTWLESCQYYLVVLVSGIMSILPCGVGVYKAGIMSILPCGVGVYMAGIMSILPCGNIVNITLW